MGNQQPKGFKGQGHVITGDGETVTVPGRKPTVKSRITGKGVSKSKVPKATEEEMAARRAKQVEAAQKRGQEWDSRLSKQKQNREKDRKAQDANINVGGGTSAASAQALLKTIDTTQVDNKLAADAKALEESGFQWDKPMVSSSAQGRSAIAMGGGGAAAAPQRAVEPSQFEALLKSAIESGDRDQLNEAINKVRASGVESQVSEKFNAAMDLLQALELSAGLTSSSPPPTSPPVVHDVSESAQAVAGCINAIRVEPGADATIKTLLRLMENIQKNPQEEKYRKLRLENAAIKTKLVHFAMGAPISLLVELGFAPHTVDGEEMMLLGFENVDQFQSKYESVRALLLECQKSL
eukprot:CAMPEP_0203796264 /NCGR_PEP_ID=MMETSP0100_2-20121128/7803_1 /ASSEMBLY_ACC=CAM_ASM_000210 /TAXON_ID=96639 /ORGANISM=" , Strain NY0313808BC1" /LENGTH=351 /DNA_ID=CAMNT_0050701093 /DNA_START=48 /DNA_END=1103 /DNA_ORIENTATION=-